MNERERFARRLRESLPRVRDGIERALERAGRTGAVTIVPVTKGHPLAAVEAVLDAGLRAVGENRVQELAAKVEALGRGRAEWHLIGHLQRNKVRQAAPLFDLIHSIDSVRLARALSAEAERAGTTLAGLVQVNVSGEETKGGLSGGGAFDGVAEIVELPGLRIAGLMTMAPLTDDEHVLRGTFARTRTLFDRCGAELPGFEARWLSMGMSNDFEVAVEEGSTLVRLGTTLLGERTP